MAGARRSVHGLDAGSRMTKIAKARGRSVEEWVGRTPDSKPPRHVVLRIFERYEGRCHISGTKIQVGDKWQVEHKIRLEDGGENREANMAPALDEPHKAKTKAETQRGKKADRERMAHFNIRKAPYKPIQSPPFPQREKRPRVLTKAMPRNLSMLNGARVR